MANSVRITVSVTVFGVNGPVALPSLPLMFGLVNLWLVGFAVSVLDDNSSVVLVFSESGFEDDGNGDFDDVGNGDCDDCVCVGAEMFAFNDSAISRFDSNIIGDSNPIE